MRIKPWMEVVYTTYERTNNEDAQECLDRGDTDIISRNRFDRKIKSLKRARKVARFYNRRSKPHKVQQMLLNELYRYYRPGSRAESCGLGNFWMGGVIVHISKTTGKVQDIYVKDTNGKRGCDILGGGGCVSHKWYEPIYHETETELSEWDGKEYPKWIGTKYITEFGEKIVLHNGGD